MIGLGFALGRAVNALVVTGALLSSACSSADVEISAGCNLEGADRVRLDDATVELQRDASGNLVDRATLTEAFTDESFATSMTRASTSGSLIAP